MRPDAVGSPLRVLVVDDNADQREILSILLGLWGHEIHLAPDGPSALVAARALHPQVVLLDIGLPGLNGWDVARRLRQQPGGAELLLIAISGYASEQDKARSYQAGFNAYLTKPTDLKQLQRLLANATAPFTLAKAA